MDVAGNSNLRNTATAFTGTGPLVIAATGNVQFSTSGTYTGGTIVNAANNMYYTAGGIFGSGAITFTGGTLAPNVAATATFSNTLNLNGAVTFAGGQNTVITGPINLVGNAFVTATNNASTSPASFPVRTHPDVWSPAHRLPQQRQHLHRRHDPRRWHAGC